MTLLKADYFYAHPEIIAGYAALCPACKLEHFFAVTDYDGRDIGEFDGNLDCPTFSPSMLSNGGRMILNLPRCHSFLVNGQWQFLNDSTHAMAGQTIPMIPIEREKE